MRMIPCFEQLDVVHERRAPVQGEVQRVVQVVIEVRARADQEVDEAAFHQLDDASAETGRRERTGHREPDGGVALGGQHLLGVNAARFGEACRVERLEPLVDEGPHLGAARRAIVRDGLAREVLRLRNPTLRARDAARVFASGR